MDEFSFLCAGFQGSSRSGEFSVLQSKKLLGSSANPVPCFAEPAESFFEDDGDQRAGNYPNGRLKNAVCAIKAGDGFGVAFNRNFQLAQPRFEFIQPLVHAVKAGVHTIKSRVNGIKSRVNGIKSGIQIISEAYLVAF